MTVVVAGSIRVPPENIDDFRPHLIEMIAATRTEDGCIEYAFSHDLGEQGLLRIFEIWRDQAALDAHLKAPHITVWSALSARFGVSDARVFTYDIAAERLF